jgi:hypothetical protein
MPYRKNSGENLSTARIEDCCARENFKEELVCSTGETRFRLFSDAQSMMPGSSRMVVRELLRWRQFCSPRAGK